MEVERRQNISFWIATELLAEEGCIVETANDGVACVDMIEKADADYYKMILMDIQMPIMNGYEATKLIRKSQRKDIQNIPVVAMSADAFAEDVEACLKAGMNGYISKTNDFKEVMKVIEKYCSTNQ